MGVGGGGGGGKCGRKKRRQGGGKQKNKYNYNIVDAHSRFPLDIRGAPKEGEDTHTHVRPVAMGRRGEFGFRQTPFLEYF